MQREREREGKGGWDEGRGNMKQRAAGRASLTFHNNAETKPGWMRVADGIWCWGGEELEGKQEGKRGERGRGSTGNGERRWRHRGGSAKEASVDCMRIFRFRPSLGESAPRRAQVGLLPASKKRGSMRRARRGIREPIHCSHNLLASSLKTTAVSRLCVK